MNRYYCGHLKLFTSPISYVSIWQKYKVIHTNCVDKQYCRYKFENNNITNQL